MLTAIELTLYDSRTMALGSIGESLEQSGEKVGGSGQTGLPLCPKAASPTPLC